MRGESSLPEALSIPQVGNAFPRRSTFPPPRLRSTRAPALADNAAMRLPPTVQLADLSCRVRGT